MNLQSFGISNFKAFGQSIQRMPLKPITLIFGPNSIGKSSLIQGLLWTLHSAKVGDFESRVSESASGSVDLGAFRSLLHNKVDEGRIKIEFSFSDGDGRPPVRVVHQIGITTRADLQSFREKLNSQSEIAVEYERTERSFKKSLGVIQLLFNYNEPDSEEVRRIILDDESCQKQIEIYLQSNVDGNWSELYGFEYLGGRRPVPADIVKAYRDSQEAWKQLRAMRAENGDLIQAHWKHINRTIEQETHRCSVLVIEIYHGDNLVLQAVRSPGTTELEVQLLDGSQVEGMISPPDLWITTLSSQATLGTIFAKSLFSPYKVSLERGKFESVSDQASSIVLAWINYTRQQSSDFEKNLVYLGPLRHLPERRSLIGVPGEPPTNRKLKSWAHLRDQPELQKQVNQLLDRFNCRKYRFQTKLLSTSKDFCEARDNLSGFGYSIETNYDDPDCLSGVLEGNGWIDRAKPSIESLLTGDEEAAYSQLDEQLKKSPSAEIWTDLVLHDIENEVSVSMPDVGVGISQMVPILIHACAEKKKLIAIEQPELHLHPALQAELGDVFIESALGENKNTFLLETHSEHLILRILRRIRETTAGDFSEWPDALRQACPNGIRPADVAVLYVQPGDEGAEVIELPVTSDGDFTCPWPSGFFTERAKELY